jgi:hypothetical protein
MSHSQKVPALKHIHQQIQEDRLEAEYSIKHPIKQKGMLGEMPRFMHTKMSGNWKHELKAAKMGEANFVVEAVSADSEAL